LWQIYSGHNKQILSESVKLYNRHGKHISAYFIAGYGIRVCTKQKYIVFQGSVETLFRWDGSHVLREWKTNKPNYRVALHTPHFS